MAVYLFGNVNGSYQKPNINLFEMAKQQNNQPIKISDTEIGENAPVIKVNISKEGLRALHGSKLKGSVDIEKSMEEIRYISEHQPVESFTSRFSKAMPNSYLQSNQQDENIAIQQKADALLNELQLICDEITSGYEDGSRVRFIEDPTSPDGFRKLSKEDELSILLSEFDEFVEKRFGKEHQEESKKIAEGLNDIQNVHHYEPEYIPNDFVEKLLEAATQYIQKEK